MLHLGTAPKFGRHLLSILTLLTCLPAAYGDNQTQQWAWSALQKEKALLAGTILSPSSTSQVEQLRLMRSENYSDNLTFLAYPLPAGGPRSFLLTGFIRGDGVEGAATLEMATRLSDGRTVRQKALDKEGKLLRVKGGPVWTQFILTFSLGDSSLRPETIGFHLDLPGRGTVYLGPLQFAAYTSPTQASAAATTPQSKLTPLSYGLMIAGCGLLLGLLCYKIRRTPPAVEEEEEEESSEEEAGETRKSKTEDEWEWEGPGT